MDASVPFAPLPTITHFYGVFRDVCSTRRGRLQARRQRFSALWAKRPCHTVEGLILDNWFAIDAKRHRWSITPASSRSRTNYDQQQYGYRLDRI
jgi:hypothetical protein